MAAKFEINATKNGKFRFILKAPNGKVVLSSEVYDSKPAAEKGVKSVKSNAGVGARFERKTSKKGEPYFVLKAANGEVIGSSEVYASAAGMEKGIQSVATHGPGAAVADLTTAG